MAGEIGKVKLNYEFYEGADSYSDGDIEEDLLKLVKEHENVEEILHKDDRWPILYHLSPVRQNILEWYPFKKDDHVLEVGAGCGAISGVLSKKAGRVTCIELSKRRSLINAYRNRNCDNLEIMVGNFNHIKLKEKFDYITLIGVLEYASYYTEAEEPFVEFLKNIRKMLKPEGSILIAIENKYGLKYWAGAREDHTGRFFDGIEGYHKTESRVRTFSKKEIASIIQNAGYEKLGFYYPFPDYKFPVQIFSENYLPKAEELACSYDSFDNTRWRLFDETAVSQQLVKEGSFEFFANSFMIEAK